MRRDSQNHIENIDQKVFSRRNITNCDAKSTKNEQVIPKGDEIINNNQNLKTTNSNKTNQKEYRIEFNKKTYQIIIKDGRTQSDIMKTNNNLHRTNNNIENKRLGLHFLLKKNCELQRKVNKAINRKVI